MECGRLCKITWDSDTVAKSRCNAFKYSSESLICNLGVVGPFGGDFDEWNVTPKPEINVLYGCLPKSKKIFIVWLRTCSFYNMNNNSHASDATALLFIFYILTLFSIKMELEGPIPQLLPMYGKKIKVFRRGIKAPLQVFFF